MTNTFKIFFFSYFFVDNGGYLLLKIVKKKSWLVFLPLSTFKRRRQAILHLCLDILNHWKTHNVVIRYWMKEAPQSFFVPCNWLELTHVFQTETMYRDIHTYRSKNIIIVLSKDSHWCSCTTSSSRPKLVPHWSEPCRYTWTDVCVKQGSAPNCTDFQVIMLKRTHWNILLKYYCLLSLYILRQQE